MMKGILFKPWKIKAIADSPLDREWQTRRVIEFPRLPNIKDSDWHAPWFNENLGKWVFTARFGLATKGCWIKSRYQVGETVYIKEAWRITSISDDFEELFINYGDGSENWKVVPDDLATYYYNHYFLAKRRPPTLFMPAWAARYFIQIADVRAERLQEISLADIYAEGCPLEVATIFTDPMSGYETKARAYEWYHDLWDTINKPPYDGQSNCWVWRYEFQLIPPINQSSEGEG